MMRGANLLVLHDDPEFEAEVTELARQNDIRLTSRQLPVTALPGWEVAAQAVEACCASALDLAGPRPASLGYEKGVAHFWRDLTDSGPEVYRAMLAIWLSKVPLVASLAIDNPFDTPWFGWIDASVARCNGSRDHWNFAELALRPNKILHYNSKMKMHGRLLPVAAGVLLGDRPAWDRFGAVYSEALPACLAQAYGHDEETVIQAAHAHCPDLFECINPRPPLWRRALQRLLVAQESRSRL
tara:strand:+ start:295 stop:1017 length:723 start_codon:yes stop_codon:yes gene_type:complete